MRDPYNNIGFKVALPAAAYAADNTPAAIDLGDAAGAVLEISVGVGGITFSGTNKIEFILTHSDDNSTYTNVALADVIGPVSVSSGIVMSLVAAHASADVTKIGYKGGKRYLKLLADFSGTHGTATPIAANVICTGQRAYPVA